MKKLDIVTTILGRDRVNAVPREQGQAFASSNIALCKYWGKRDAELNLPMTSSLSISLGQKGALCTIHGVEEAQDSYALNNMPMSLASPFGQRLSKYLDLFRTEKGYHFDVDMQMSIPFAAGLASSACGFASLVLGLNDLFSWELNGRELSILARLGSGSACRSITPGFVEWHAGCLQDGMDSYGQPLMQTWPALCIGLLIVDQKEKPIASRVAMEQTVATSALYAAWPAKVGRDLALIKQAIAQHDFQLLGETAESNALSMHALMLSAWPPISYALPETISAMQKIWKLRQQGLSLYFTQDAGPNLKLLFLDNDQALIREHFSGIEIVQI